MSLVPKQYLADGVYIEDQDWRIKLTTSDGIHETNTIYIDGLVWEAMKRYMDRIKEARESG